MVKYAGFVGCVVGVDVVPVPLTLVRQFFNGYIRRTRQYALAALVQKTLLPLRDVILASTLSRFIAGFLPEPMEPVFVAESPEKPPLDYAQLPIRW